MGSASAVTPNPRALQLRTAGELQSPRRSSMMLAVGDYDMALGDFTQQSGAYRRSRPNYPVEMLEALVSDAGLNRGDCVADFGAGTGIFTRMLVDRGLVVSAIEPNESMRKLAGVPEAHWIDGTFEASQLATASQRWAVAAQAFHWAVPTRTLPEIRRILRPQTLFTVLWNDRAKSENEITRWTEESIRRHVPEFDEAYRDRPWNEILESTGDFVFVNQRTVSHTIVMSHQRFKELWNSHNRLNTIAGPVRFAAFFKELSEFLEAQPQKQIEVRYHCKAWSARRKD